MRFKLLCSIALITLVVGVAIAWRGSSITPHSRAPGQIKVVIDQLPAKNGLIPVEIMLPTLSASALNRIDDVTFAIRNNSTRAISAVAVSKDITYEEADNSYTTSLYSTLDFAFHPDLGSARLLEPGDQTSMESGGPISFDADVVIKEITLRVQYVLYDDNTAFGSGGEGDKKVNLMREGVRKYKDWLKHNYLLSGKSFASILPLMQDRQPPAQLKLNLDQTLGADRYRLYLLKTLQTKGAADVEKYLDKTDK